MTHTTAVAFCGVGRQKSEGKLFLIALHQMKKDALGDMQLLAFRPEYEANVFAASVLLDEDEMLELIYNYQYDAEQIAKTMRSDINLVALKVAELARCGHNFRQLECRADFLK
ncbi:MAG: hypothetical protein IIY79_00250 [Ruminococcus sp.]|nr:hypothetical protein [Ruminococcus sp.]